MRHCPSPVLALALFVAAAPALCADLPEIEKRGKLRVIVADGEQPEMFDFDGDPAKPGLEREMLEGFASLKRLELQVVRVPSFAERIPALLRGDGDLVVGLVDTAERRRQIGFSAEVMPVRHVVVSHKPRPVVESLQAFRSRKAGVVRGTAASREAAAAGASEAQVEVFADTEPMLEALESGRVEAAVMRFSDFTLAATRRPGLEAGLRLGAPARAAWGVRRQDAKLKAELDTYLQNLRSGPSWNRLLVLYFGERALGVLGRAAQ